MISLEEKHGRTPQKLHAQLRPFDPMLLERPGLERAAERNVEVSLQQKTNQTAYFRNDYPMSTVDVRDMSSNSIKLGVAPV